MTEQRRGAPIEILLVEDNPGDVRLVREAFADVGIDTELSVVRDGEEALDYLFQRGEYGSARRPNLVLLDLNLPRVDGIEVLEAMKGASCLKRIPVIVLTSSEAEEDIVESYERQANAYLTKPIDPEEFLSTIRTFEAFWIELVELPPGPE